MDTTSVELTTIKGTPMVWVVEEAGSMLGIFTTRVKANRYRRTVLKDFPGAEVVGTFLNTRYA